MTFARSTPSSSEAAQRAQYPFHQEILSKETLMSDIRTEMIEASFQAGNIKDLSRMFAAELRDHADPKDADILTGWIENTRDDFVKVPSAAARALEAAPKSSDAPHSLRRLSHALIEFAVVRCDYPAGMTQASWRAAILDAAAKLDGCADGILAGDRQAYADLKCVADFLRRYFKDLA